MTLPALRITMPAAGGGQGPILKVQATGQPGAGSDANTGTRPLPSGTDEAQGAFGIFGLMISGLIILFAVVLLVRRLRSKPGSR
jgi:hypothetical protein